MEALIPLFWIALALGIIIHGMIKCKPKAKIQSNRNIRRENKKTAQVVDDLVLFDLLDD
jgi:hypothetical protein